MQENKEYTTPELIVYGNVEELTKGPGRGYLDSILGVVGIVVGDGDGGWIPPYDWDEFHNGGSGS